MIEEAKGVEDNMKNLLKLLPADIKKSLLKSIQTRFMSEPGGKELLDKLIIQAASEAFESQLTENLTTPYQRYQICIALLSSTPGVVIDTSAPHTTTINLTGDITNV